MLRKEAVGKEQSAAKLRIEAWTIEGKVSAVTQVPPYSYRCEDRVRDGPASGEKGSKGEFHIGENLFK